MSIRLGVKQVCGHPNQLGELWDGTYPVIVSTYLTRTDGVSNGARNEVWQESENIYTLFRGNTELVRVRTKRGDAVAYKMMLKKHPELR